MKGVFLGAPWHCPYLLFVFSPIPPSLFVSPLAFFPLSASVTGLGPFVFRPRIDAQMFIESFREGRVKLTKWSSTSTRGIQHSWNNVRPL